MTSSLSSNSSVPPCSASSYHHIPFTEFSARIRQLCKQIWPTLCSEDVIIGEPQEIGSNRVFELRIRDIPITFVDSLSIIESTISPLTRAMHGSSSRPSQLSLLNNMTDYVLQIPLHQNQVDSILPVIAILEYVRSRTAIPVAKVVSFDRTVNNTMGSPYALQMRMSGESLLTCFPLLNQAQRKAFVVEYVKLLKSLQKVTSPVAGGLGLKCLGNNDEPCVELLLFSDGTTEDSLNMTEVLKEEERPLDMFLLQVSRRQSSSRPNSSDQLCLRYLRVMVKEMDEVDCFGRPPFVLDHGNPPAWNIQIQVKDVEHVEITSISGWQGAMFVPQFVSCVPPWWIWDWVAADRSEYLKEPVSYGTPADPDARALKDIFDELVGKDIQKLCYLLQYRLARKLFYYLCIGRQDEWDPVEVKAMWDEWSVLRPSLLEARKATVG